MKPFHTFWILTVAVLLSSGISAQSYKLDNGASSLKIDGTSNIHDWTIEAENTSGMIVANFNGEKLEDITKLDFTVVAESLMSGKSGMDKNTYKALDTDTYEKITFQLKDVKNIEKLTADTYKVRTTGVLMIAGKKKMIDIEFQLTQKHNKLMITGDHKIEMSDYGVDPPTAMFGTIKTGDTVKISFNTFFNK